MLWRVTKWAAILKAENSAEGRHQLGGWLQRRFTSETLTCYGVYELHVLDDVAPQDPRCEGENEQVETTDDGASSTKTVESEIASEGIDSDEDTSAKILLRNVLRPSNWDDCEEQSTIPYDVNDLCKFRIQCNRDSMRVSQDGRPWGTWVTRSRKDFQ